MSRDATSFRPFARMGWGGRAASHWRGLIQSEKSIGNAINRGQVGTVIYRSPGAYQNFRISGITKNSAGAVLGNCRVELMLTAGDRNIAETTSDASGNFRFDMPGTGPFYLIAYKAGSPDVAGTTVNTLLPDLLVPTVTVEGPVGEIILSGTTFTSTQLKTGLVGLLDEETAGRIALLANGQGALIFTFTGTGFNIAAYQGASGQPTDMMEASVDGAAFASMGAASGGVYAVTGLANALHTVIIRTNVAYGNGGNIRDTGTVLTIIGGTSITLPRNNQAVTQGLSASIMKSANTFDTVTNAGIRVPSGKVFPGKVVRGPNENGRRNTPSFRIKTNATSLWIYGEDSYIWINDGTATTRYALNGTGSTVSFLTKLTGFSGLKSYSMWGVQNSNFVVAPFDGDFFTIPETGTFDEYGDSVAECIAYGVAADFGEATVYKTAVGLGRIGGNFGVSGNTIANLKARIDAILNNKEITSKDVAYVTIGRNNADAALDATEISDYTYIVNALLAKPYGRIICRGVLGETSNPNPSVNTDIAAIVSGFSNARVVYCSVTGWTTSWNTTERPDGVHLSVAGTNALNTLQLANLPTLIGTL